MAGIGVPQFYSKPHRYSDNFELRRFSSYGSHPRPETDFFEFYWAHHFPAGRLFATLRWLFVDILFRRPFWGHQPPLRRPIGIFQAAVTVLALILLVAVTDSLGLDVGLAENSAALLGRILTVVAVLAVLVLLLAGGFLTRSLADARFYLSRSPGSLKARNEIRAEGLALLHALHDAGTYQRIIIVGHSLGSVIGLDLLRLAWDELRHPDPALADAPADDYPTTLAENFEELVDSLPRNPDPEEMAQWQHAQHELWNESRRRGMRWLVTDFITLGSPLAHADFLLSRSNAGFQERKAQREYPECPPIDDRGGTFYSRRYTVEDGWYTLGNGSPRNALVAHHGAPFAVTRWSNAYFPRWLFFGDLVGGPLARQFGRGVRDVAVRAESLRRRSRRDVFPWVHSHYWRLDPQASAIRELEEEALRREKQTGDLPGSERLRQDILDRKESLQQRRRELDKSSGTQVAYLALVDFLRLNNQKAAKNYPAPPGPPLRR
ncbi:hypothetical protein CETAM_09670 [Corynebacterium comes]|uniref:Uncharacterized protein n=2 Tax=Corynebacterium comes TaxID=2675218 RepID=A0A6B8VMA2_9CORY|nr:hypothetical protein CETAM_09670 [Corynebacterium comes]